MEEVDEETLDIFCSSTGADESTGRLYLARARGDLDGAIDQYYDAGEEVPVAPDAQNDQHTQQEQEEVRSAVRVRTSSASTMEIEFEGKLYMVDKGSLLVFDVPGYTEIGEWDEGAERIVFGADIEHADQASSQVPVASSTGEQREDDQVGLGAPVQVGHPSAEANFALAPGDCTSPSSAAASSEAIEILRDNDVLEQREEQHGELAATAFGVAPAAPAMLWPEGTDEDGAQLTKEPLSSSPVSAVRVRTSSMSTIEVEFEGNVYMVDKESLLVFDIPEYTEVGIWDADTERIMLAASGQAVDVGLDCGSTGHDGDVRQPPGTSVMAVGDVDEETLDIFCSSTGADESTGRLYLSRAQGDLDDAIDKYFDESDLAPLPPEEVNAGMIIVATFSEQGRLGVNFGPPDQSSWPSVKTVQSDSLADHHRPRLLPGLILHAVEGASGRRIVEHMSFEDGIRVVLEALPSTTGQPITLTFKRGLLMDSSDLKLGREYYESSRVSRAVLASELDQQRSREDKIKARARRHASFPQGISQLLILGPSGSLLAARDYRTNMPASSTQLADAFNAYVLACGKSTPPVFVSKRGDFFIHVQKDSVLGSLRFVFATRSNCFPSLCIEMLSQFADLVDQYCGGLSEEIVRANLTLIHELLDEAFDYGLPQLTRAPALLDHVFEQPRELAGYPSAPGRQAAQLSPMTKLSAATGQNEVFIDVCEHLSATFGACGSSSKPYASLLHAELEGEISMRSYLRGRQSELRMVFNQELLIGEQLGKAIAVDSEESNGVEVADAIFHDTVQCDSRRGPAGADLSSVRVLKIRPPTAERISVMRYRVSMDESAEGATDNIRIPFRVGTEIETWDPQNQDGPWQFLAKRVTNVRRFVVAVHLHAVFPETHDAENVGLRLHLPPDISCLPTLPGSNESKGQRAVDAMLPSEAGQVARWQIQRMRGGTTRVFRLHLQEAVTGCDQSLAGDTEARIGPLELHFSMPMLQCSRVELKNVRVYDGGKSNEDAYRWLRYHANGSVRQHRVTQLDGT